MDSSSRFAGVPPAKRGAAPGWRRRPLLSSSSNNRGDGGLERSSKPIGAVSASVSNYFESRPRAKGYFGFGDMRDAVPFVRDPHLVSSRSSSVNLTSSNRTGASATASPPELRLLQRLAPSEERLHVSPECGHHHQTSLHHSLPSPSHHDGLSTAPPPVPPARVPGVRRLSCHVRRLTGKVTSWRQTSPA